MALPKHEIIIEENGIRVYRREEGGPQARLLRVWTIKDCLDRLRKAQAENRLQEVFEGLTAQMGSYGPKADPMMHEWFKECFENASKAYDQLTAPIEEFGYTDDLEEFGV